MNTSTLPRHRAFWKNAEFQQPTDNYMNVLRQHGIIMMMYR